MVTVTEVDDDVIVVDLQSRFKGLSLSEDDDESLLPGMTSVTETGFRLVLWSKYS